MKTYVRITFLPAGAKRRRTTWAVKLKEQGDIVTYLECDSEGETTKQAGFQNGVPVERSHLIVCTKDSVVERPARMNNHYAELELVADQG